MKKTFYLWRILCVMTLVCSLSLGLVSPITVKAAEDTSQNDQITVDEEPVPTTKTAFSDRVMQILPQPATLKLAFVGDMNLAEGWPTTKFLDSQNGNIYECISPELIKIMQDADIFMPNNEFTYSERGSALKGKAWTFRANPLRVSVMQELGADITLLANNHTYDYGPDSLIDTLDTLNNANIAYVGAGKNLQNAIQPYYYVYEDLIVAYVAASQAEKHKMTPQATDTTPGILRCYDMTLFLDVIKQASKNADIVIANIHWGTEGSNYLEQYQRDLAYQMIDAGADAIVGSHAHVLQGMEFYNGKPIMYNLGNFWFNAKTMYTGIYELEIDTAAKEISGVRFVPATQTGCQTIYAADDTTRRKIFDFEEKLSINITIDNDGYVYPTE
ncbi:MAG: CapA family protein [Lachnospiraceae bacterium]|nr:CapA family protein [Lachnospiraceae bacterium]